MNNDITELIAEWESETPDADHSAQIYTSETQYLYSMHTSIMLHEYNDCTVYVMQTLYTM